jgi:hypothetical protein
MAFCRVSWGQTKLVPNADGADEAWDKSIACNNHYECVDDDPTHDGATTNIFMANATNIKNNFQLPNTVISGTIDSVLILAVLDGNQLEANDSATAYLYDGTNTSIADDSWDGTEIPSSYGDSLYYNFTIPPDSEAVWTQTDIDNLQIGLIGRCNVFEQIACTQLHALVYSTEAGINVRRRRIITQ